MLSGATAVYERARVEDAPPWAYWAMEAAEHPVPVETGRAWAMVGNPRRAAGILAPKIGDLVDFPRDVALVCAYLAEAHHLAGDRDQAADYAGQARAGLAGGVRSPRTAAVLAGL